MISIWLLHSQQAVARGQLRLGVSLSGYYVEETETSGLITPDLAPLARIAMGELRLRLDGRDLAGRIDLRVDVRSRISGTLLAAASSFDFESKFGPSFSASSNAPLVYRGYLGGPQFVNLRELSLGVLLSERLRLAIGRMYVEDADGQKIDGIRLRTQLSERWQGSLFFGGAPNNYSAYLLTDYDPPCGNGVASGNQVIRLENPIPPAKNVTAPQQVSTAGQACEHSGPQLALAAGMTARFTYERKFWGALGLSGAFYGGPGAGGPVLRDESVSDRVGNLLPASTERDAPRVFVSLVSQANPLRRFSLMTDLVLDLTGTSGTQVTRAVLSGNLGLLSKDRLNLRATYSYLSGLAIGMYLRNMLYNRSPNGTTLGALGVVENNLSLLRTARHEARLALDWRLHLQAHLFSEGRLRFRSLLGGDDAADVYLDSRYSDNTRNIAGDATIGLRDNGSLRSLRGLASYSFLQGFRATSHSLRATVGYGFRSEDREFLSVDLEYAALLTADLGAGSAECLQRDSAVNTGDGRARIDPALSVFLPDCFGRRRGSTHEAGLTAALYPSERFFFLLDYRFSAQLTDSIEGDPSSVQPTLLSHSVLLRMEGRIDLLRL